jgi:hypothetical protein
MFRRGKIKLSQNILCLKEKSVKNQNSQLKSDMNEGVKYVLFRTYKCDHKSLFTSKFRYLANLNMPKGISKNKNKNLEAFIYNKLVPDEKVKNAFRNYFPKAKDIEWTYKSNSIYEAVFSHQGYYKNADISTSGELKEVKTLLEEEDLPKNIIHTIDNKYHRTYIISCIKVENPKQAFYEVIFDAKDKTRYLMLFDHKGKFLKKESLFVVKSGLLK